MSAGIGDRLRELSQLYAPRKIDVYGQKFGPPEPPPAVAPGDQQQQGAGGNSFSPQQMQTMQAMINEPWFKQRQWEQYGSPNANIGSNMAGTAPVAYGGGVSWFTPGLPPAEWDPMGYNRLQQPQQQTPER